MQSECSETGADRLCRAAGEDIRAFEEKGRPRALLIRHESVQRTLLS